MTRTPRPPAATASCTRGAGGDGKDIARPAEILIDPSGTVRWINLTEDFRVRARPEEVLRELDQLNGKGPGA